MGEAVSRDAAVLLADYRAGAWLPDPVEREFAGDMARARWDGHMLRAALRDVPPTIREGRLIAVLVPAVNVLDGTAGIGQDVELRLRVLVDAPASRHPAALLPVHLNPVAIPVAGGGTWSARVGHGW